MERVASDMTRLTDIEAKLVGGIEPDDATWHIEQLSNIFQTSHCHYIMYHEKETRCLKSYTNLIPTPPTLI